MINFFTKLLTPVFITLGLVSPEPIIETQTSEVRLEQEVIELRQKIAELEDQEPVGLPVEIPEEEIREKVKKVVVDEVIKENPTITVDPVVQLEVERPVAIIVGAPVVQFEDLDIQCLRHNYFDFDEIQETKEFYLKLVPSYGELSDFRIRWDSSFYEGKFQEFGDIFEFQIHSRGTFGIHFSAEDKETGEEKDFKCSVEVFKEKVDQDVLDDRANYDREAELIEDYNEKLADIQGRILERTKQFNDDYYNDAPGQSLVFQQATRRAIMEKYNSDILTLEIEAEELRLEYQDRL